MSPRKPGEYRRTLLTCARFTDIIDRQPCKLTRFATETSYHGDLAKYERARYASPLLPT
jgi:hypothetical protein